MFLSTTDLVNDILWLERVIESRIKHYFEQKEFTLEFCGIEYPRSGNNTSPYGDFIQFEHLSLLERLALILALIPDIKPKVFDIFLSRNEATQLPFTEFGCVTRGDVLYATGETLAFLLGGDCLKTRFEVQQFLQSCIQKIPNSDEYSSLRNILSIKRSDDDPLLMKSPLTITDEYLHLVTTGEPYRPDLSPDFPAEYVNIDLEWSELVLPKDVMAEVENIRHWITDGETLLADWGFGDKIRPGFRALFYGPPGTGKTLTACLLGKSTGRDVYKVDLSLIVSKYIGETEKNLEKVFSLAENKHWILLFDEADALFGKRNQATSANDQFTNQNVAYLLQRIERFNGVAILASNLKENLDEAFFRRFESTLYFPLPGGNERLDLWHQGFSDKSRLEETINLKQIAQNHTLSGAEIMNVIRYASMQALRRGNKQQGRYIISLADLEQGIHREQGHYPSESGTLATHHQEIFGLAG